MTRYNTLATLICSIALSACGGGGGGAPATSTAAPVAGTSVPATTTTAPVAGTSAPAQTTTTTTSAIVPVEGGGVAGDVQRKKIACAKLFSPGTRINALTDWGDRTSAEYLETVKNLHAGLDCQAQTDGGKDSVAELKSYYDPKDSGPANQPSSLPDNLPNKTEFFLSPISGVVLVSNGKVASTSTATEFRCNQNTLPSNRLESGNILSIYDTKNNITHFFLHSIYHLTDPGTTVDTGSYLGYTGAVGNPEIVKGVHVHIQTEKGFQCRLPSVNNKDNQIDPVSVLVDGISYALLPTFASISKQSIAFSDNSERMVITGSKFNKANGSDNIFGLTVSSEARGSFYVPIVVQSDTQLSFDSAAIKATGAGKLSIRPSSQPNQSPLTVFVFNSAPLIQKIDGSCKFQFNCPGSSGSVGNVKIFGENIIPNGLPDETVVEILSPTGVPIAQSGSKIARLTNATESTANLQAGFEMFSTLGIYKLRICNSSVGVLANQKVCSAYVDLLVGP